MFPEGAEGSVMVDEDFPNWQGGLCAGNDEFGSLDSFTATISGDVDFEEWELIYDTTAGTFIDIFTMNNPCDPSLDITFPNASFPLVTDLSTGPCACDDG